VSKAKYTVYEYNYGEAAHEAFTLAQGRRWSKNAWLKLDRKTKDAWVAAALCVMYCQAQAVLV
jgi:hypothetical protein